MIRSLPSEMWWSGPSLLQSRTFADWSLTWQWEGWLWKPPGCQVFYQARISYTQSPLELGKSLLNEPPATPRNKGRHTMNTFQHCFFFFFFFNQKTHMFVWQYCRNCKRERSVVFGIVQKGNIGAYWLQTDSNRNSIDHGPLVTGECSDANLSQQVYCLNCL